MRGHMWLNKVASVLGPLPGKSYRVLFENRPALYFCKYKEKKNNTRILDTLFIDDFSDIMVNISIISIIIK